MVRHAVVLFIALLVLCASALACQYCVIDPQRPGASTGFYVARPSTSRAASSADTSYRVFDPNGDEFRIRGVNRNHWDSGGSRLGVPLSGANAERIFLPLSPDARYPRTSGAAYSLGVVQADIVAQGMVPIPVNYTTTCKSDQASLSAAVDTWVNDAATWTPLSSSAIFNIANEWGPSSTVQQQTAPYAKLPVYGWRDGYVSAVQRMRAAGYSGLLMIDAAGCGQDVLSVVRDGPAVLESDPLHNVVFSVHVYGSLHYPATASWMQDYATSMARLKASGLPVVIGEFGPVGIGPSPTAVPADKIIGDAEANGWGWMPWSWDDNNSAACASTDVGGFSMTRKCGAYTGDDVNELTAWGRAVVPMLKAAQPRRVLLSRP